MELQSEAKKIEVPIESVDLFITEECNLNCSYCFHKQSSNRLTVEQGKVILDKLKIINPERMLITFFGGEPLMYPDVILQLMQYARMTLWPPKSPKEGEQLVQSVGFHIVTNATYFDEELFKKFKEYDATVQVSFDGDEPTQMEHRGGDFNAMTANIKNILRILPKSSVRMTFTPQTIGRLAINVQFLHNLGFSRIMHHAVIEADWNKEALSQYAYQLNQIYHYRRYSNRIGRPLDLVFIDKPLKIANDELPPETDFCQAGKSYLAILPNGDIYPCHRAASNRIFKLGSIYNEKRPFVRGMFLNINKEFFGCLVKCEAARTCHSCVITHYMVNKDVSKPIPGFCEICRMEYNQARAFLPTELSDRNERMLLGMGDMLLKVGNAVLQLSEKLSKGEKNEIK